MSTPTAQDRHLTRAAEFVAPAPSGAGDGSCNDPAISIANQVVFVRLVGGVLEVDLGLGEHALFEANPDGTVPVRFQIEGQTCAEFTARGEFHARDPNQRT